MQRLINAYWAFTRAHILKILEYRTSFFIGIVAVFTRHIAGVLTLWVIFTQISSLGGWSREQVLFLYGFVALVGGVHHFFFLNTFRLEFMIQDATLDRYLVRPLPVLYQMMLYYFDDDAIGDIIPALLIIATACAKLSLTFTPKTVAIFISGIVGGTFIFFGIHLILCSWSFWFIKSRALIQLFSEIRRFSEYPLNIFSPTMQLILSLLIPIAFAGFYPAEGILNQTSLGWMAWLSLPVGLLCMITGYMVFRFGLTKYQSVGS